MPIYNSGHSMVYTTIESQHPDVAKSIRAFYTASPVSGLTRVGVGGTSKFVVCPPNNDEKDAQAFSGHPKFELYLIAANLSIGEGKISKMMYVFKSTSLIIIFENCTYLRRKYIGHPCTKWF